MDSDFVLFANIQRLVQEQGDVWWIYLTMLCCLATRAWLSLRLLQLPRESRRGFLDRTFSLADATGNISLLFGVLGTLVGVTMAVTGKTGSVEAAELLKTFSAAYAVAVSTTIAGGLTYTLCYLLSSLDEYLAER
jgi:hypothetical protein